MYLPSVVKTSDTLQYSKWIKWVLKWSRKKKLPKIQQQWGFFLLFQLAEVLLTNVLNLPSQDTGRTTLCCQH